MRDFPLNESVFDPYAGRMMFGVDDTIVAISTAAGSAQRGIVRLSGDDALRIAETVFTPSSGQLTDTAGFRSLDGVVRAGETNVRVELPARVYVFRAPRSYTRQDVVELHVPGASVVAIDLSAALIRAGARQGRPGEFTERAFFSGRIDLSEAEAVADLIDATDQAQLRSAVAVLGGRVHRLCQSAGSEITEALATVEASIDLAEENITLQSPEELASDLAGLAGKLQTVARDTSDIPETAELPHVVLAGKVNVGKSSLLNALSGTDRAIVSALAGTTRDVLSASMTLSESTTIMLQDAAGFASPTDPLEAAAHTAATGAVRKADAILFVTDVTRNDLQEDVQLLQDVRSENRRAPIVVLCNKIDLVEPARHNSVISRIATRTERDVLGTSALTRAGLEELRRLLTDVLHLRAYRPGSALGLHKRQKRSLEEASKAVERATLLLKGTSEVSDRAELIAIELRESLARIGQISGEVVTEDVLGRIFARFCVGK